MIEKLKKAGLGYTVGDEDTKDKFGRSNILKIRKYFLKFTMTVIIGIIAGVFILCPSH